MWGLRSQESGRGASREQRPLGEGARPSSRLLNPGQRGHTRNGLQLADDTHSGLDSGCPAPTVRPPDTQGSPFYRQLHVGARSAVVQTTGLPASDCQPVPSSAC